MVYNSLAIEREDVVEAQSISVEISAVGSLDLTEMKYRRKL